MKILFLFFAILLLQSPHDAITRGDISKKNIAIVFTGDEFGDGAPFIRQTLKHKNVKGSFFLTGNFYRNAKFEPIIKDLKNDGHYLGSHSDKHLLYCDWVKRDSLLVTKEEFDTDIENSYRELANFGVTRSDAHYFLPPYEWYNDSIVAWTSEHGLQLVNFTPGTRSNADYTYPEMNEKYVSSNDVFNSIINYERISPNGLNGFILLVHIGTDPRRKDKFYRMLPQLIDYFQNKDYTLVRIDQLLNN